MSLGLGPEGPRRPMMRKCVRGRSGMVKVDKSSPGQRVSRVMQLATTSAAENQSITGKPMTERVIIVSGWRWMVVVTSVTLDAEVA